MLLSNRFVCIILALGFAAIPVPLIGQTARADADPEALIDALNAVFGKHDGKRAAHTNGICVKGAFTPSERAGDYSKAPHLMGKGPFPLIGRFSMGGGVPDAPHTQKDNVRGLAMHIDIGKGNVTDMVLISAPVFAAKTPEQFLTLLQTVASKDAEKIGAFFKANPESTRQAAWLMARPVPASYATATYFGVHTFTLTNGDGQKKFVKWHVVPKGGDVGLSDEDVKSKAADFYKPELTDRLAKGPAIFDLIAVIGSDGDEQNDPTVEWTGTERKSVVLGEISIAALEDNATCDAGMFDPTNVIDGIEGPANDPIFAIRSSAYAVSLSRRGQP